MANKSCHETIMTQSLDSHETVRGQSCDSHETVMWQSRDSHVTVFRQSLHSHETVWDSHETDMRQSWDSHETVYYSTLVAGFSDMSVPVCSHPWGISLAPSASQTKHTVQPGKLCWHWVLDCGLGPRLVTRTVKKKEITWSYGFEARLSNHQTPPTPKE